VYNKILIKSKIDIHFTTLRYFQHSGTTLHHAVFVSLTLIKKAIQTSTKKSCQGLLVQLAARKVKLKSV